MLIKFEFGKFSISIAFSRIVITSQDCQFVTTELWSVVDFPWLLGSRFLGHLYIEFVWLEFSAF